MSAPLPRIVDAFAGLRVLVVGEAMLDCYLQGPATRLCPEEPAPIVDLESRIEQPGGAANSSLNALCLGADVSFLSVVGDDAEGENLARSLRRRGVEPAGVLVQSGRRTLAKHRVMAGSRLLVRFDQGDGGAIARSLENRLITRIKSHWETSDAVIVSDYGYGVLTPRVIAAVAELQARAPRTLVVDSKRLALYRDARPTAVKPNRGEALTMLGGEAPASASACFDRLTERGAQILKLSGARIAAVTLDEEGALVFERDRPTYRTYAQADRRSRVAGAGDTFAVALALALTTGAETPAAADLASAAAAVVVGKDGTATCNAAELRERVSSVGKKLEGGAELAEGVASLRRRGRRVVFTNGCFDILHRGHVSYLSRAKSLGDALIVGVNSDESIQRIKGPTRPINTLEDRLQVLAALSCVDHVVPFDEDTPHELIRVVRPDVFVKGGDYTRATLPEASLVEELGGIVEILPFLADRSTTDVIEKIRRAYGEMSEPAAGIGELAGRSALRAPALEGRNGD